MGYIVFDPSLASGDLKKALSIVSSAYCFMGVNETILLSNDIFPILEGVLFVAFLTIG